MIITKAKLEHIPLMREILQPEVQKGVILERSEEVMANMIRSYRIAWQNTQKESDKVKENQEKSANSTLLGLCALHIHSLSLGEIRSLIVAPAFRRKGVATALILDCLKEAKELGLKEVLVLTYNKALFEGLGFNEVSKEKIPNQKIWADCILCKHFPLCDEIALIKVI